MTAENNEVFECPICGKAVRLIKNGKGVLNCCGQAMVSRK